MIRYFDMEVCKAVTQAGQEVLKQLQAKLLEHGILVECKTILTY